MCYIVHFRFVTSCFSDVGWLCWGLTSQSTIFQSCRDGAITSWVINQYFRGVTCLAQGHNTAAVGLEPRTSRSGVRHSTTEPPRSPLFRCVTSCISDVLYCAFPMCYIVHFRCVTLYISNVLHCIFQTCYIVHFRCVTLCISDVLYYVVHFGCVILHFAFPMCYIVHFRCVILCISDVIHCAIPMCYIVHFRCVTLCISDV